MNVPVLEQQLLRQAVSGLPDDALRSLRESALARFGETGLPTLKDEDWRYTNLAPVADLGNAWLRDAAAQPAAIAGGAADTAELPVGIDADWIALSDGDVSVAAGEDLTQAGIVVSSLSAVYVDGRVAADDALTSLNAALLRDGIHIRVPAGTRVARPVGIQVSQRSPVSQARIVIDVEENAHVSIIERHAVTDEADRLANTVVQLNMGPGAAVDYVRLQDAGERQILIGRLLAQLERGSRLDYATFDFGGNLVRNDIVADIVAPQASVNLHGLYLAGGKQHIDNHTRVDHRVGPADSAEEFRGILAGRSRCIFNGKAIVHAGADGTDARQENHNLLLSERAEIDTKPELEIYADDVKCSHGATVGQLDEAALFYLRSRGLDRNEAARALTQAFATRVLDALPVRQVHEFVADALEQRLDDLIGEVRRQA